MFGLAPLPRTLPAALRDVRASRRAARLSALRDLARHAGGEGRAVALEALRQALADDAEPAVRGEAAVALADAHASECVETLLGALRDDHPRVRQMALMALGEVSPPGDARVSSAIEVELASDSAALRFQALVALHHRGAVDAAQVERSLGDDDPEIRRVALHIAEERWPEPSPALLGAAARALDDAAPGVRVAAALFLAKAGDERAGAGLAAALNGSPRELAPEDEQAAIELAGELELAAARPGLERRAFGALARYRERFQWHARIALARLGDARARAASLRGLTAWSRDARTLAVVAGG
ncbi:MAG: HEAT repeat domain-containing protein, partial [Sorangiineae bacterium]|nr:HEAT repeat domain-containing protein [Sorangiineae bacterium]